MNKALTVALFALILASLVGGTVRQVVRHEIAIFEQRLPLGSGQ